MAFGERLWLAVIDRYMKLQAWMLSVMGALLSRMGLQVWWQQKPPFSAQQLDDYQDCTFFNRQDILRLYKRFHGLSPGKMPSNMQGNRTQIVMLSFEEVERMPELKENPFRRRLCEVFSEDGYGNLTFDDFIDMFSCLSELAPLDLKLKSNEGIRRQSYGQCSVHGHLSLLLSISSHGHNCLARQILGFCAADFDKDDVLGRTDLQQTVHCLTRDEMSDEEINFIIDRILEEADLDGDGTISYAEFEHIVSRSPDFIRTFHVRI